MSTKIPREEDDDYTRAAAEARLAFAREMTGSTLEHVGGYSFDPAEAKGNIEHFTGAAQVPLGIAGPLRVNGEHANGDFYVPLATAEGTLVASYDRGHAPDPRGGRGDRHGDRRRHAARTGVRLPLGPRGA